MASDQGRGPPRQMPVTAPDYGGNSRGWRGWWTKRRKHPSHGRQSLKSDSARWDDYGRRRPTHMWTAERSQGLARPHVDGLDQENNRKDWAHRAVIPQDSQQVSGVQANP